MLGTVVVHLQRELAARIDGDVLDLETPAGIDRVVGAPRPVDLAVVLGFAAAQRLEFLDQLLDLLHAVLPGDHDGVLGFHHHDIFQADHRDQLADAMHQAVVAVLQHHVALDDIAVAILLVHVPDRRPAADVAPAGVQRHHAGARGLFHHRVVD
ncbi:hypothetical protein D9M68_690790 [compost metagenome]